MERQIPFPVSEYQRRLQAVRSRMAERELDALVLTSPDNIFYVTGYQTFGGALPFLVLTHDRDPVFILRELESHLVDYTSWAKEVRAYGDSEDPIRVALDCLRDLGLGGKGVGFEQGSLSARLYRQLCSEGRDMKFLDGSGVVESCRVIKSPLEIAMCREAARLTALGMEAAVQAVEAGATENQVAVAAYRAMTEAGAEWLAIDPIVTSGPRSGIPHTTYARRRLEPGDAVLIELGACYNRYFGPLMRSCTVGPAPAEVQRMHDACVEALEAVLAGIGPGMTSGEAHALCQSVIDRYGYTDNFKKRLGYSVGLGFKSWSEGHIMDLKAGDERVLQPGMVFHMPPALRVVPRYGVGLSETIVITENGCECLTQFPRRLFSR